MFVNEYNAGRRVQHLPCLVEAPSIFAVATLAERENHPPWPDRAGDRYQADRRAYPGGLLGVTPQGWMRDWPRATGGKVKLHPSAFPGELMSLIDAMIVSDEEVALARDAVEQIGARRRA